MGKDISADGLRGIAAGSVVLHHFLLAFFPLGFVSLYPWVAGEGAKSGVTERVISHPLLIALWNGQLPVCIFFVLSGYVLTKRYFATGDGENIRSQAARRYIRLGVPVFASVMLAYVVSQSGAYGTQDATAITHSQWLVQNATHHVRLIAALKIGVYAAMLQNHIELNRVLWTMRVELIGSMLIFAYCLLAGRRHVIASATYAVLVVSFAPRDWPYYIAFLIGAHIGRASAPSSRVLLYAIGLAGYLIASTPLTSDVWLWLPAAIPRLAVASVLGGALIVYAIRFGIGSWLLRSRPVQFLGRISYPLYLIHLTVLLSVGCWVFAAAIHAGQSRCVSASLALLTFLAVTLPLSWLFERYVDASAVRFAKWVMNRRLRSPLDLADAPVRASR